MQILQKPFADSRDFGDMLGLKRYEEGAAGAAHWRLQITRQKIPYYARFYDHEFGCDANAYEAAKEFRQFLLQRLPERRTKITENELAALEAAWVDIKQIELLQRELAVLQRQREQIDGNRDRPAAQLLRLNDRWKVQVQSRPYGRWFLDSKYGSSELSKQAAESYIEKVVAKSGRLSSCTPPYAVQDRTVPQQLIVLTAKQQEQLRDRLNRMTPLRHRRAIDAMRDLGIVLSPDPAPAQNASERPSSRLNSSK